jgi:hypothetical protein
VESFSGASAINLSDPLAELGRFFRKKVHSFILTLKTFTLTGSWMIAAGIGTVTLQCSWTPNVETILYDKPDGHIALQTGAMLKIAPKHPSWISENQIKIVLGGVTKIQETGMLQQLLLNALQPVPAFSPSQIEFLAPHLSAALSKATPEEIVFFKSPATDESSTLIEGTISVFPPTYLLLTLTEPTKTPYSSRKFQHTTSLAFSQEEAVVKHENVKTFMAIPATAQGILINFQKVSPPRAVEFSNPSQPPTPQGVQNILDEKQKTFLEIKRLQEQLQDLQRRVDQQTKELHRLQQAAPQ